MSNHCWLLMLHLVPLVEWRKSLVKMFTWYRLETFWLTVCTYMGGGRGCVCAMVWYHTEFCVSYTQSCVRAFALDVFMKYHMFQWNDSVIVGVTHHRPVPGCCSMKCILFCLNTEDHTDQIYFSSAVGQRWSDQSQIMKEKSLFDPELLEANCLVIIFTVLGCRRFICVLLSSSTFTSLELETCHRNAHEKSWVAATRIHFIQKAVFANA